MGLNCLCVVTQDLLLLVFNTTGVNRSLFSTLVTLAFVITSYFSFSCIAHISDDWLLIQLVTSWVTKCPSPPKKL